MKVDFQTCQEIRQQIWKELGRASQDRHHAWRTPVLATTGQDGTVNARTVVLRSVDQAGQTLQFFTDQRSPKVAEIANEPKAMFVFLEHPSLLAITGAGVCDESTRQRSS